MDRNDDKITLVINTKNEEKNIKDCILSAKDIVDEIIVVDMASSDKTVEIAEELGAKVFKIKDYGYVEPARNFALSKPTTKWTLVIDGDERLTKDLRNQISQLVKGKKYDGFKFPFKNILLGKWIKHGMWWPDFHLRLFKTGYVDWPIGVHQEQNFRGSLLELEPTENNAFVHYGIVSIKELLARVDDYSSVEALFKSKKNLTPDDLVKYLNYEFKWRYFEHKGYLDGIHGFILGKFMDFYRLLEVAKFWEKQGYKEIVTPISLKKAVEDNLSYDGEIKALREEIERLRESLEKIQSVRFYIAK